MRADSYLTRHDGLLATAVYHPRKPEPGYFMYSDWAVSPGGAGRLPDTVEGTTVTSIPGNAFPGDGSRRTGMNTTATPVCAYRLSLHR
jgi:hypothetical protein